MFKFFARLFIKENSLTPFEVRQRYGELTGVFGIVFNLLLVVMKLITGLVTNSLSVIADAMNNLSDVASSVVTLIGFRLSGKKADKEHPYGHGRIEYVAGLIVSFLVLLVGVELLKESIQSIIHPDVIEAGYKTIVILIISICIKIYMFSYAHYAAKKTESAAMEATARDYLSDIFSTIVVLLSIILSILRITNIPFDAIAGIIVAIFIFKTGIQSTKETISPIIGEAPSKEFIDEIIRIAESHEYILGAHDVIIHEYGPSCRFINLDVEVPGNQDVFKLHDSIESIRQELMDQYGYEVVIHMDPVDVNSKTLTNIKTIILKEVEKISKDISVHDIRFASSTDKKEIVFETVIPYDVSISFEDFQTQIKMHLKKIYPKYTFTILVERPLSAQ